ncbi:sulfatase family protein [Puniceicoccus vermicola]|uniref:Sulfatase n=1 Tax=Puniceicoccus vermicola TaxID=388746 RepID=A0A7X1E539_9BACT|nr:sulfatase [Puniceicoccus vermicola]MBC2603245.1 sulfatase [Puniceicoccus vermicola]
MKRPNIVYIFADEWRAQATGYNGDPNCETPVLDAFAAQSMNLTHAVSGYPVCCPYRASLLTGQYPLTHGVFINDVELDPNCHSIARAFKDGGYHTAYIGKWHVYGSPEGHYQRRNDPVPRDFQMGFDDWKGFECSHDHLNSGYYHNDDPTFHPWGDYDAFAQSRAAVDHLRERSQATDPFLLMLSWGPPHFPLDNAPEEYLKRYENREIVLRENVPEDRQERAIRELRGYYAHIAALDHALEIVLDGLRDLGLEEETMVIVTSDHGEMRQCQGLKTKQFPWDESIRVPFLLRYPPVTGRGGSELPILIDAPDIMPTLLHLCDLPVPESVEGRDWSPEIRGTRAVDPEDAALLSIAAGFTELRFNAMSVYRGVRSRRHTYVRNLHGPWLLYDNEADPYQKDNLIDRPDHADLQAKLENKLQQMLAARGDEFLPGEAYLERAGLTHYHETQSEPQQIWRDPWKSEGPVPVSGRQVY